MSKTSFPGQASCQGLEILAKRCHPSTGSCQRWGNSAGWRRKEQVSTPYVFAVSAGVPGQPLSHSWRWESQLQPRDGYSGTLVPPSQAPAALSHSGKQCLAACNPSRHVAGPSCGAWRGWTCHQFVGCCQPSWVVPAWLAPGCPRDAIIKPTAPLFLPCSLCRAQDGETMSPRARYCHRR